MATKYLFVLSIFTIMASMLPKAVTPTTRSAADKPTELFKVYPIGMIHKRGSVTTIEVDKKYQDALLGLDGFSHVWVFWWFDRNDTPDQRRILRVHPRGNSQNPLTGVFATRSPSRPNLIALTPCKIMAIENNVIRIEYIDALPDTPVLDLKPYIPEIDFIPNVNTPDWINR